MGAQRADRPTSAALSALAGITGREWLFVEERDVAPFADPYSNADGFFTPSAVIAPASVEEVQAVVRIANEHGLKLWPISRGKNLGYGGAAPVLANSVTLDLGRMNRILELDERLGYCVVEPGVGFFDLFDKIREEKLDLWMSVPGNAWGSVIGNALDRGLGHGPYMDHSNNICGMEVVLPQGELMRTGMGAMANNSTWNLYKHGFGPSWDQMFVQSNFGITTKMGLWLEPAPESSLTMNVALENKFGVGALVDTVAPLRLRELIEHDLQISNYIGGATMMSQRADWQTDKGPLTEETITKIRTAMNVGWWNFKTHFHGLPASVKAKSDAVRAALEKVPGVSVRSHTWQKGEPIENSAAGIPAVKALQMVNWHGGRGGHAGFSPVLPALGELVQKQTLKTMQRYEEFGQDYFGSFFLGGRSCVNVNMLNFRLDDKKMVENSEKLFRTLIADAATDGYGEYRTHVRYMQAVTDTFDYNGSALRKLNETVKDVLDPNGILAPGKSGIWPKAGGKSL